MMMISLMQMVFRAAALNNCSVITSTLTTFNKAEVVLVTYEHVEENRPGPHNMEGFWIRQSARLNLRQRYCESAQSHVSPLNYEPTMSAQFTFWSDNSLQSSSSNPHIHQPLPSGQCHTPSLFHKNDDALGL